MGFIAWMKLNDDSSIFIAYLFVSMGITLLYLYKLFRVISNNRGSESDVLLQSITKYTVLAIVWISTSVCFWSVPFLANMLHSKWYLVLYHAIQLLDVSTNDI